MPRPDDAIFRTWVEAFALLRKLLPIALLAGALAGPLFRFEPTVAMWLSALLVPLVLVGLYLASQLPLYPAHTFGLEYRYEEEPFDADQRECVRCGTPAESGTHRRYAKQIVVLGVPVHTLEWGDNDFCPDCVALAAGVEGGDGPTPNRSPEPTADRTETAAPDQAAASDHPSQPQASTPRTDAPAAETATPAGHDTPRLEPARRVDRTDETTALELKRAFE
ncbi:hypothetical protein [Natrinema marinum]|uniref:hypothetical protein n=1 Tax=Natrinema marinum TaxID=2961598 RepID=UPI0020C8A81C|nr:hypothetical protein [Natrinema marinum]